MVPIFFQTKCSFDYDHRSSIGVIKNIIKNGIKYSEKQRVSLKT